MIQSPPGSRPLTNLKIPSIPLSWMHLEVAMEKNNIPQEHLKSASS